MDRSSAPASPPAVPDATAPDDQRGAAAASARRASLPAAPGLWIGLGALALGGLMIVQSWGQPFMVLGRGTGPMALPLVVGYLEALLGLTLLIRTAAGWDGRVPAAWPDAEGRRQVLGFALLAVAYVVLLERAGFFPANLAVGIASLRYLGRYAWWKAVLFALLLAIGLSLVFEASLNVSLPRGWLSFR